MINLNTYIVEKFKITKDFKDLKYPVKVEIWSQEKTELELRNTLNEFTKLEDKNYTIYDLRKNNNKGWKVFLIEVNDRDSLLWLFIYAYGNVASPSDTFVSKDIVRKGLENADEINDYIEDFSKEEYQERLTEYIHYYKSSDTKKS